MKRKLIEYKSIFDYGYCLWIGAGVTKHLSNIGSKTTPMWNELVEIMEDYAGLPHQKDDRYQKRLQNIYDKIGHKEFQIQLRNNILKNLTSNIIQRELDQIDNNGKVPEKFRQIAKLGIYANPIINFNIETLSSWAIADYGGPFEIKCFNPIKLEPSSEFSVSSGTFAKNRHRRLVYHPHGALNLFGTCIMKDEDYSSTKDTLAFQLAVHSAFVSDLFIVCMSLKDNYLKKQIVRYRNQIKRIIWASTNPNTETKKWAKKHNIELLEFESWNDFWLGIDEIINEIDEEELLSSWYQLVQIATQNIGYQNSILAVIEGLKEMHLPENNIQKWIKLSIDRGEQKEEEDESTIKRILVLSFLILQKIPKPRNVITYTFIH